MTQYYLVSGWVAYRDSCSCPNCEGHEHGKRINTVVAAESESQAVSTALKPMGDYETSDVVARVATLRQIERAALADWNAQRPTASPLALAMARGEL